MLLEYFGFRDQPFGVTPDPRFLYYSHTHREALASLVYGIESGRGFSALIAGPGMGKTTLLFRVLESLQPSARTAFVFQTQCNSSEFLSLLLADLGIDGVGRDLVNMHQRLNEVLVREAQEGRRCIVVLDEAHNLDISVLETVRLLSNFETPHAKLLQIVIAGQAPLADKLASAGLEQLRQRISTVSRLAPFESEEVEKYIAHRLRIAGYLGEPLFSPEAQSAIVESSAGIPRKINNLCFNALSLCCALKQRRVERHMVEDVVADLDLQDKCEHGERPARQGRIARASRSVPGDAALTATPSFREGAGVDGTAIGDKTDVISNHGDAAGASEPMVNTDSGASIRCEAARGSATGAVKPRTSSETDRPVREFANRPEPGGTRVNVPGQSAPTGVARTTTLNRSKSIQSPPQEHALNLISKRSLGKKRSWLEFGAVAALGLLATLVGATLGLLWQGRWGSLRNASAYMNAGAPPALANPSTAERKDNGNNNQAQERSSGVGQPTSDVGQGTGTRKPPAVPSRRSRAPDESAVLEQQSAVGESAAPDMIVRQPAAVAKDSNRTLLPSPSMYVAGNLPNVFSIPDPAASVPTLQMRNETPPQPVLKIRRMVQPAYPPAAKIAGIEGTVLLKALVDSNGDVKKVTVQRGNRILALAAVNAVKNWHYEPYQVQGVATDLWTTIRIDFSLSAARLQGGKHAD